MKFRVFSSDTLSFGMVMVSCQTGGSFPLFFNVAFTWVLFSVYVPTFLTTFQMNGSPIILMEIQILGSYLKIEVIRQVMDTIVPIIQPTLGMPMIFYR